MQKLDNKFKHILPAILLLLLITIIIGVTYAVYTLTITGNENSITTGLVSMSYTESTNVIDIKNALPISDTDGKKSTDYFDFSVTSNITLNENDPNAKVSYTIDLEPLNTNTLNDNQIKVYLENTTGTTNKVLVEPKLISTLSNYKLYTTSHTHKYNTNIVTTNYRLRAWIDYNVDATGWTTSNTYEYKFRVNVNGDTEIITPAVIPTGSALATIANSVTSANISYKYRNGANRTENGIAYNVNDNGVFLYDGTDDNAGEYPIYYYRGNVTNNNVLFGGFCWKIVRTTSTGGTKLIYNGVPDSNGTCTSSKSPIGNSEFNTNDNSPADVGYMYGTRYTSSYKNMSSVTDTYKYGNDVTYSNGTYTLTGKTMNSSSWSTDRTTIADGYHYTCLNSTGTCTSVYYITDFDYSNYMHYLTFTGGDNLDSAKTKMFANTNDSTIKTYIDNWYSTNLTYYTSYLENTIFCNDRTDATSTTFKGPLASKDANNTRYSYFKSYESLMNGTPSLTCSNINDRFSLKEANGGTNGYGNNALTYPVGLLTYDEAMLAGGAKGAAISYYLSYDLFYWFLSPYNWDRCEARVGIMGDGAVDAAYVGSTFARYSQKVFPSISLQLGTEFEEGTDGTPNNPYVVKTS